MTSTHERTQTARYIYIYRVQQHKHSVQRHSVTHATTLVLRPGKKRPRYEMVDF